MEQVYKSWGEVNIPNKGYCAIYGMAVLKGAAYIPPNPKPSNNPTARVVPKRFRKGAQIYVDIELNRLMDLIEEKGELEDDTQEQEQENKQNDE